MLKNTIKDTLTIENSRFEVFFSKTLMRVGCVYARALRERLRAHLETDYARSLRNRLRVVTNSYAQSA